MSYTPRVGNWGRAILATFIFSITACQLGQDTGPKTYLIPWMDPKTGSYSETTVELTTLSSPERLAGDAAEIYYQNQMNDQGFVGSVAEVHVTRAGGTYVPTDVPSSLAVAAYAQYEMLQKFDVRLNIASDIRWPRKVGVDMLLKTANDDIEHNNAHYIAGMDVTVVVPYNLRSDGLAMGFNQGILAHEHFHEHFQALVLDKLSHEVEKTVSALESMFYAGVTPGGASPLASTLVKLKKSDPRYLNNIVIRAWNEGLADLYGALYSKQPNFFAPTDPRSAQVRGLAEFSNPFEDSSDLSQMATDDKSDDDFVKYAYEQGTVLSRTLYDIAMHGSLKPEDFLVHVMGNLKNLPPIVNPSFAKATMNFNQVLPALVGDLDLNARNCDTVSGVMASKNWVSGFASCLPR